MVSCLIMPFALLVKSQLSVYFSSRVGSIVASLVLLLASSGHLEIIVSNHATRAFIQHLVSGIVFFL